ncbi:MAG: prephenate dehydrogenase [Deferribacterota bacterium]|nr:prephenate dehydrogenase [Deferribacterota bacterium]
MNINSIGIVGAGLIGGSFAYAFYDKGYKVYTLEKNTNVFPELVESDLFEGITDDVNIFLDFPIDLIYICIPIKEAFDFIAYLGKKNIKLPITDALSTKVSITRLAKEYNLNFCGGHPIAGSEYSGFSHARRSLFVGAKHILVECDNIGLFNCLKKLHTSIGMDVVSLDANRHDKMFGLISHLPHLIAFNLIDTVLGCDREALDFTGAGFKDFTRIAGSSPALWSSIFLDNKDNILEYANKFIEHLSQWLKIIEESDENKLIKLIKEASNNRNNL